MYGIFTNICPRNHPNVGKYTIHGAYGSGKLVMNGDFLWDFMVICLWDLMVINGGLTSGKPRKNDGKSPCYFAGKINELNGNFQ